MSLEWELVGKQQLWERGTPGKGYAYVPMLWRTPVPGGWLLMTLNSKSNDPQPMVSFYPDPDHVWRVTVDPQAKILLRPAHSPGHVDPALLLRAADAENEES